MDIGLDKFEKKIKYLENTKLSVLPGKRVYESGFKKLSLDKLKKMKFLQM